VIRSWSTRSVPALLAVVGLMAVGCQQTTQQRKADPKPAPVKAAETKPAKAEPVAQASSGPCRGYTPALAAGMGSSMMAFPTGDTATSAILVHEVMPKEVRAGAPYSSEIHVTNLTNGTLQNVLVTGKGFQNYTLTSSTPAGTAGPDGVNWTVGELGPCKTQIIKLTGTAGKVGISGACVMVSYNNSLCATTNVVEPALAIIKSGPAEVLICDPFPYKIIVKNPGSGQATNVRVRDNLPAGLTTTDGKTALDLPVGTLGSGESKEFTVNVKAAKAGTYSNTAGATADGGLTVESAPVSTVVRSQSLAIKAECPPALLIGRNATFKFVVSSTGDANCTNTQVSATLPAGADFVSADNGGTNAGGKVTWNIGNLNAKDARTVSFVVRSKTAGTLQTTATATCGCAAAVTDSCSTGVKGVPDIGTNIGDDTGVVNIGAAHVFTYTVKNQGQTDLTNVTMVADFDAGLDYVSTTAVGGATAAGSKVTWKIGTLKVGDTKVFTITVKGSKEGELVVQTTTTSDQTKPVRNDEQVNYIAN